MEGVMRYFFWLTFAVLLIYFFRRLIMNLFVVIRLKIKARPVNRNFKKLQKSIENLNNSQNATLEKKSERSRDK